MLRRNTEGAKEWARVFNLNWVLRGYQAAVMCPLFNGWTPHFSFDLHGMMLVRSPWSGQVQLTAGWAVTAHTTLFTRVGWSLLAGNASGLLPRDADPSRRLAGTVSRASDRPDRTGSFVTYSSPSDPKLFSVVVETTNASTTYTGRFKVSAPTAPVINVWRTNIDALDQFGVWSEPPLSQLASIHPQPCGRNFCFSMSFDPHCMYTLSTLKEPLGGAAAAARRKAITTPPHRLLDSHAFPLPWTSDFGAQSLASPGKFLNDMYGAFEVVTGDGSANVLRQMSEAVQTTGTAKHHWGSGEWDPATYTGGIGHLNYDVSVSLFLEGPAPLRQNGARLCGRVGKNKRSTGSRSVDPGICLLVNASGADGAGDWRLAVGGSAVVNTLAQGSSPEIATQRWMTVSLSMYDEQVSVTLNGRALCAATLPVGSVGTVPGGVAIGAARGQATPESMSLALVQYSNLSMSSARSRPAQLNGSSLVLGMYGDGDAAAALRSTTDGWVGMILDVGPRPLLLQAVGRFKVAGNGKAHRVKLVAAADKTTDLLGAPVPPIDMAEPSDALGFVYADVRAAAVTLAPNTSYYVMVEESVTGDAWLDWSRSGLATNLQYSTELALSGADAQVAGSVVFGRTPGGEECESSRYAPTIAKDLFCSNDHEEGKSLGKIPAAECASACFAEADCKFFELGCAAKGTPECFLLPACKLSTHATGCGSEVFALNRSSCHAPPEPPAMAWDVAPSPGAMMGPLNILYEVLA